MNFDFISNELFDEASLHNAKPAFRHSNRTYQNQLVLVAGRIMDDSPL